MRDLFVSLLILGLLPICFRKPFVGLLLFSLLAYMRLQDLTWGFARGIRWSYYVAIVVLAGFFASSTERRFMVNDLRCYGMILLVVLVFLSVVAAGGPTASDSTGLLEFVKIIGVALFTTGLVRTRERLRMIVWAITFSFAFFGFKAGLVGIATGGGMIIDQGPGGMLQDNNDFALALAMGVPMLWHVASSEKRPILRRMLFICVPLQVLTIAMTHSRGGFLALCVGFAVLIWYSRNRMAGFVVFMLAMMVGAASAPDAIIERIQSIKDYEQDDSARARLHAWATAGRMIADNPITGVGFRRFERNYVRYDPTQENAVIPSGSAHVAHNSYLQIWAECGTPAFALYLLLMFWSIFDLWRIRTMARLRYHASWIINYSIMFEASLLVFMAGSFFLNRAHFDLTYHWMAIIIAFGAIARRELEDEERYPTRVGRRGVLRAARVSGFGRRPQPGGFGQRPSLLPPGA